MSDISLSQLLEAGVHFGHKAYRWNPKMFPYIYSEVNNIHILDLVQSATLLKEANSYLKSSASEGKTVLFVGTKRQASTLIAQEAKRCDSFYVNHRWLGGMLTNWSTLKERIKYLKDLEQQEASDTFSLLTKKEAALRRKELKKLRQHLDGIKTMPNLPDIAIIIDQKREMTAIREAACATSAVRNSPSFRSSGPSVRAATTGSTPSITRRPTARYSKPVSRCA